MNLIDIFLGILLIFFGYVGWSEGLFRSISGLVAIILSFSLGLAYMIQVASKILRFIALPAHLALFVAFLIIVGLVSLAFRLLGSVLHKAIRSSSVSAIDSIGGLFFGLFKGSLVCSVLILFLTVFPFSHSLSLKVGQSRLGKSMTNIAPSVFNSIRVFLPKTTDLYSHVQESLAKASQLSAAKKAQSTPPESSEESSESTKSIDLLKQATQKAEERKRALEELHNQ